MEKTAYTVGSTDFAPFLRRTNLLISRIIVIREEIKLAVEQADNLFEINREEDPYGVTSPIYNLSRSGIDEVEKGLVSLGEGLVWRWTRILVPNIDTDLDSILSERRIKDKGSSEKREMNSYDLGEGFDAFELFDLFVDRYVKNALEISKKEILDTSRDLLRYSWIGGERMLPKVSEILNKNVLRLEFYSPDGFYNNRIQYDDKVKAFIKLSRIVLEEESAVTVSSEPPINLTFRSFKNGRLDVKFKTNEDAKKVADVLINGF